VHIAIDFFLLLNTLRLLTSFPLEKFGYDSPDQSMLCKHQSYNHAGIFSFVS